MSCILAVDADPFVSIFIPVNLHVTRLFDSLPYLILRGICSVRESSFSELAKMMVVPIRFKFT